MLRNYRASQRAVVIPTHQADSPTACLLMHRFDTGPQSTRTQHLASGITINPDVCSGALLLSVVVELHLLTLKVEPRLGLDKDLPKVTAVPLGTFQHCGANLSLPYWDCLTAS